MSKIIYSLLVFVLLSQIAASQIIDNTTTNAWSTSNINLNGSSWTGEDGGGLRINKNASYLNGLVGSWDFDENLGTTIHNVNTEAGLINTTNTGTWNGNTTLNYSTGIIGNAGQFDGIDDYVDMGGNVSLNISSSITVSVWINKTSNTSNMMVLYKGSGLPDFPGYDLYYSGGLYYWKATNKTPATYITTTWVGTVNMWGHIVAVYDDNTHTQYLYKNGILVNSTTDLNQSLGQNSNNLIIGKRYRTSSPADVDDWFMNGSLDEIRVWNRALSEPEISEMYNRSLRNRSMTIISNQIATNFYLINRTKIVYTGQDTVNNISIYARQNGTTTWYLIQENATSNTWYNLTNKYEVMDFGLQMNGNGSNTPFLNSLEWDEERIPSINEYIESTCSSVTSWGIVGFSLILILLITIGGTFTIGWITGTMPRDSNIFIGFTMVLISVTVIGLISVSIINPIYILIGCQ